MKPDTEAKLDKAMDHLKDVQVELASIRNRAPRAIRAFKQWGAKNKRDLDLNRTVKDVCPLIDRFATKAKRVDKDLEKLLDQGNNNAHDYYDGREFRDRNKALLVAANDVDRQAGAILVRMGAAGSAQYPGFGLPDTKALVNYLKLFTKQFRTMKLAINSI